MTKLMMVATLAALLAQDATIRLPITFTGALTAGSFVATTTTEPPLVVSSQVQVANLNASLLGGQPASAYGLATPAMRTRGITYIAGCDYCPILTASDSQPDIYINIVGAMLIRQVRCLTDGPTVTIGLTITGQPSTEYACPGNTQGLALPMALNDIVGLTVGAGASAHRVTFAIAAEVQ